jgi:hypothetical protein
MLRSVISNSEALTVSIIRVTTALTMEAVGASEMSDNFYQITLSPVLGNTHFSSHRHENLKTHMASKGSFSCFGLQQEYFALG